MARVVICVVAAIALAACVSAGDVIPGLELTAAERADAAHFESFIAEHQRSYGIEERVKRFRIFQDNLRTAEALTRYHSTIEDGAVFGVTRFSDMTPAEFKAQFGRMNATRAIEHIAEATAAGMVHHAGAELAGTAYPPAYDWTAQNKVTPVVDQADCGCCWAFAATGEYESQIVIRGYSTTPEIVLSKQQFVDCDSSNSGCNGGFYVQAWQYAYSNGGVMQDAEYEYEGAASGSCKYRTSTYNVKPGNGGSTTPGTTPTAIYQYVSTHGPAAAAIDSSQLQFYKSGILSQPTSMCRTVDHAVLITGYDSTKNYYKVRNCKFAAAATRRYTSHRQPKSSRVVSGIAWSASWGEKGYFRITPTSCQISSMVYGSTGF